MYTSYNGFERNLRTMQYIFIVFNGVWHLSNSWKYIPFLSFVQIYPKYAAYCKHKIMKRLDKEKKLKLLLLNAKSRLLVFRCWWVLATLKVTSKHKHIMAKLHRDDRYYTCKKLKLRIWAKLCPTFLVLLDMLKFVSWQEYTHFIYTNIFCQQNVFEGY